MSDESYIPVISKAFFLHDDQNPKSELVPEFRYSELEFEFFLCYILASIKVTICLKK